MKAPTMKHSTDHSSSPAVPDLRRRTFLRAAGGAGALATLAVATADSGAAAVPVAAPVLAAAEPVASGYRETEHIRQYYRSAKYW